MKHSHLKNPVSIRPEFSPKNSSTILFQLSRRVKILIVLCTSLSIFIIYRLTASPTIGWIDSGIIAATATSLGIPNPPGFPAYLLLAHLFTKIPLGTIVFRLQLLSELSAIGIALCVFFLVKKYATFSSALYAMIALSFSYNIWQQANNVETYTLTNFVLFGLVAWVMSLCHPRPDRGSSLSSKMDSRWSLPRTLMRDGNDNISILALGLFSGLAMGLNPTIAVLAATAVVWIIWNRNIVKQHPGTFFCAIGFFIIGAIGIYSYLPIRAATHPFINWGDPSTPERIKNHLFGSGLNIYEPETNSINGFTWQPIVFWQSFLHFLKLAIFQFTPVLFPLVILGGWVLFQKNRTLFSLLFSLLFANMIGIILYYGGNQESWMITSWMVSAVFLGIGISYTLEKISTWAPSGNISPSWSRYASRALLATAFLPLVFWYPILDHSKERYADEYAQHLYKDVPEGSIIIGGGDFFNSLTAYTHEVTKERRDIISVTGNMFYIFPWYRENLRKNTDIVISQKIDDLIKFKKVDEFTEAIDLLVEDNPSKSIFVTPLLLRDSVVAGTTEGTYHTKKYALVPHGLLLKIEPLDTALAPKDSLYQFPVFDKTPYYMERNYTNALRLLVNDYAVAFGLLGEYFLQKNDLKRAFDAFSASASRGTKDSVEFIHRLAIFYAQTNQYDQAKSLFTTAIAKDPENETIKRNYQMMLNQSASASASLSAPLDASASGNVRKKTSSGLSFSLPPDFEMSESGGKTTLLPRDKTNLFQIDIQMFSRSASESIEAFMTKQPLLPGAKLLEQGQAKIPNVDIAFVRVLRIEEKSTLEFFLFQANVVIRLVVSPSDSPNMRVFDEIVTSMKI